MMNKSANKDIHYWTDERGHLEPFLKSEIQYFCKECGYIKGGNLCKCFKKIKQRK